MSKTTKNYNFFLKTDTSKYRGEWIAIANQKIVAHGQRADRVLKDAEKKSPNTEVSLAKVPKYDTVVY